MCLVIVFRLRGKCVVFRTLDFVDVRFQMRYIHYCKAKIIIRNAKISEEFRDLSVEILPIYRFPQGSQWFPRDPSDFPGIPVLPGCPQGKPTQNPVFWCPNRSFLEENTKFAREFAAVDRENEISRAHFYIRNRRNICDAMRKMRLLVISTV